MTTEPLAKLLLKPNGKRVVEASENEALKDLETAKQEGVIRV